MLCPKTTLLKRGNIHCSNPTAVCKGYQIINRNISGYVDYVTAPSNIMLKIISDFGFFSKANSFVVYNAAEFDINKVKNKKGEITSETEGFQRIISSCFKKKQYSQNWKI